jgi:hypothetical protein
MTTKTKNKKNSKSIKKQIDAIAKPKIIVIADQMLLKI